MRLRVTPAQVLSGLLLCYSVVDAQKVELVQNNLVNVDSSQYEVRHARYSGDFVFSYVAGINDTKGIGRLANFDATGTSVRGPEISLDEVDPVDLSFQDNNLAISFGVSRKLVVFKNLEQRMSASLPYNGSRDVVGGRVDISGTFVVVLEYELIDFPLPDVAQNAIHVYSFAGDELVLTGSIERGRDGYGDDVSLLSPSGTFDPTDPSKYYASDASNILFVVSIDANGVPEIDHIFDHPFTGVHIRSIEVSQTGKFLAMLDGNGVSVLDTTKKPLELLHQSASLYTIASCICWSANDYFMAVGTVFENTLILDVSEDFEVYINETLPGSMYETNFCSFGPSTGLLTMDSILQATFQNPLSQNLTTYEVTGFREKATTVVTLPPLPTEKPDGDGDNQDLQLTEERACFPSHATVVLANGKQKRMDSLLVGDQVHVGAGKFEEIFFWSHHDEHIQSEFFLLSFTNTITNKSGELTVSSLHYVYTPYGLKTAASVIAGSHILDGETFTPLLVQSSVVVQSKGLFNPHTPNGNLVVNGVLVSCYTATVPPSIAHNLLRPVRLLNHLLPSFSTSLGSLLESSRASYPSELWPKWTYKLV